MPPKITRSLEYNYGKAGKFSVNVISRAFIAVIDLLESDSSQFLWKIQRNLVNVSLVVTSVPAKSKKVPFQPIRVPGKSASEGTPSDSANPAKDP